MFEAECAALDDGTGECAQRTDRRKLAGEIDLARGCPRGFGGVTPAQPEADGPTGRLTRKIARQPTSVISAPRG
jgi:hypothetical protein